MALGDQLGSSVRAADAREATSAGVGNPDPCASGTRGRRVVVPGQRLASCLFMRSRARSTLAASPGQVRVTVEGGGGEAWSGWRRRKCYPRAATLIDVCPKSERCYLLQSGRSVRELASAGGVVKGRGLVVSAVEASVAVWRRPSRFWNFRHFLIDFVALCLAWRRVLPSQLQLMRHPASIQSSPITQMWAHHGPRREACSLPLRPPPAPMRGRRCGRGHPFEEQSSTRNLRSLIELSVRFGDDQYNRPIDRY